ncbi:alpha/beta hydrolase fold domain containing protein [Coccidioides posadasii C735 delta SOWgp]|uniref:Alpha/beta hydrolase fold domain containing protein n=1 Tax=Coccidioides posadasii (strain C735) TaxID=222929 RepID=C5P158_COCP7|nr:alpha/beta hydrolase fold domain containing protein [Coccidioides posadasii C735 delta SOWgp]EER29416.1 alpha/beta hydrolase fold domain containing protein [Coccidioides posadasii C735 delta SOWgp]|eukprot:XP_003071561.1 alpha/beta hydrolase fold domain containing protein [Coccidioides posadasii C735 delta SOWgp]
MADATASPAVSRIWLLVKAVILRALMRIGMFFHGYPLPGPPAPHFTRRLPGHSVKLHFYTPKEYANASSNGHRYPVVVNFHGGGFCLGRATDDARWAQIVTNIANAVVVSVDYRLAPEHPFPAAVDDGVEALLYLQEHASELHLDTSRVTLSGFSAGGNLVFSVPLLLRSRFSASTPPNLSYFSSSSLENASRPDLSRYDSSHKLLATTTTTATDLNLRIVSLVSWYPVLDFVLPRDVRRGRCAHPKKSLPSCLTTLFDNSYLPNHDDRSSPFASPIRAPPELICEALPTDVFIYMCEWDMLLHEGQEFVHQLEGQGKRVRSMMIEQSKHAWDKSVNPFRDQGRIDVFYLAAAEQMKKIFEEGREMECP